MFLPDPTLYLFTLHATAVLAVGSGVFCLGTFVLMRERASRAGVRFWLFTTAMSVWLLCFGMAYASIAKGTAYQWFLAGEVGVLFIPATVLALAVLVAQRERELRWAVWLGRAVSIVLCWVLLTSDRLFRDMQLYPWGWYPRYGWAGVLFIVFFFAVAASVTVLFFQMYRQSTHPRTRNRVGWVLLALAMGYLSSVDFAPSLGIRLYPFGYLSAAFYLGILAWIAVRYRLMDIRPELATGLVLETMHGAVLVVDLEDRVRIVNQAAEQMLGYAREDLLGKPLDEVLPSAAALAGAVRADGHAFSREMTWRGRSGRKTEVVLSAAPILDGSDRAPVGTVFVAHDITERKHAEERLQRYSDELRNANRRLEELDRIKSELVTVVSHELRTPLTTIKAFAELLLIKPGMPRERKDVVLRKINDESDRLARLINELLDLSRIENGTMIWRRDPVSLPGIIRSSVDALMPLAQNKGVLLSLSVEGTLPGLQGDHDRLIQVLTNLLSNAVKYTPAGGTIRVAARREETDRPCCIVTVQDSGIGISAEDLPHIFDKFHRSRTSDADTIEGTGLGLAISRQIVEHHGGTLQAESRIGEGSVFTVVLPVGTRSGPAS